MKHIFLPVALAGLCAAMALPTEAKDVYVYTPEKGELLQTVSNVKRIEFLTPGKMTLVPVEGDNIDIDLANAGSFALHPVINVGVSEVDASSTAVRLDGDVLTVTSDSEINQITIYNTLGQQTGLYTPRSTKATIAMPAKGVSIVLVETDGISQTYKIAR